MTWDDTPADVLPLGQDGGNPALLPLTLAVAEALEKQALSLTGKGLMPLAALLVADALPDDDAQAMLKHCLRLAGSTATLPFDKYSARILLAETLLALLAPLQASGAVMTDDKGDKYTDFKTLRQFFLGVLGWTPETLRNAPLRDIAAARQGYARNQNPASAAGRVSRQFMADMMRRFPDGAPA